MGLQLDFLGCACCPRALWDYKLRFFGFIKWDFGAAHEWYQKLPLHWAAPGAPTCREIPGAASEPAPHFYTGQDAQIYHFKNPSTPSASSRDQELGDDAGPGEHFQLRVWFPAHTGVFQAFGGWNLLNSSFFTQSQGTAHPCPSWGAENPNTGIYIPSLFWAELSPAGMKANGKTALWLLLFCNYICIPTLSHSYSRRWNCCDWGDLTPLFHNLVLVPKGSTSIPC